MNAKKLNYVQHKIKRNFLTGIIYYEDSFT